VPLSRQLHRSRGWLNGQLAKVGATLAVLHAGPPELAGGLAENPLEKEAKVIRRAGEHIQALLPDTADCLHGLLDRALALHRRLPQEPPTFTHSDFKCDHLLAGPRSLTLIDFDTCALADPALDLGKFLADLDWWFTLEDVPGVEQAQAAFLHGYGPEPGEGRFARARLYHALILAKIALRRAKLYLPDWAALTDRSVRRADAILRVLEQA
jgi:aminoglycoside phosphotransferase (APT) family kinase protein